MGGHVQFQNEWLRKMEKKITEKKNYFTQPKARKEFHDNISLQVHMSDRSNKLVESLHPYGDKLDSTSLRSQMLDANRE